jgi:hypothetical protein
VSKTDRLGGAAVISGLACALFYWILAALIRMSCVSQYYGNDFVLPQETALLISVGFAFSAFSFAFVMLGKPQPDRFEKGIALLLFCIMILWLAFVLVDDQGCSAAAWKRYAAYLIVPSFLCSVTIVGRRWMSQND